MARIILVDDEPAIRRNLARYLTAQGHDVRAAGNGREALLAFDEGGVDLLITDINMPEMDGIEILNALRARGSSVPVIAMSGGGQFDKTLLLGSATMLGAVVTLEKPFELDQLLRAVDGLLPG
jgi:DNA-binding response OmpR family regulator